MWVKITRKTFIGGKPVNPGEVHEVTERDGFNIIPGKGTKATDAEIASAKAKAKADADAEAKAKEDAAKKASGAGR